MLQTSAIDRSAVFDLTGHYRYSLGRCWGDGPGLTILMLNPSRADAQSDDPTIRRCVGLAQGWGFGAIQVVNLFAYCTAYPRQLRQVDDPVGPENDVTLGTAAAWGDLILLAWGNWGHLGQRDAAVLTLLTPHREKLRCLGRNRTGQPRHPLYVKGGTPLKRWAAEERPQEKDGLW